MLGGVGKEAEENAMRLSMVNESTYTHTRMPRARVVVC